ncbi:hypothetical protein E4J66_10755 [Actinomyces viscosus]|uniref:hypothetical protein n=1 Tax=Actinomyces viscosus TaxID=1656 RepID=UPI000F84D7AB|nr:hypothetical protein [Actinomyces viscosus]TFH51791.1 hypothetical protein E4J66_10755 [Actinomyces viscosus]
MARSDMRRSVCAKPRDAFPARIHFCFLDAESVDVRAEIAAVAQQVVAPLGLRGFAKTQREAYIAGEIRGRMRAMARGRLPEESPSALSPVVSQPDLFELRWKFVDARNALVRAYHGEPGDPDVVVVCIHRKETNVAVVKQRELQNAVMAEGQRRFTVGEQCRWGHTRVCSHCLDP